MRVASVSWFEIRPKTARVGEGLRRNPGTRLAVGYQSGAYGSRKKRFAFSVVVRDNTLLESVGERGRRFLSQFLRIHHSESFG